ncbi:MAG: hypothetical protein KF791_12545, partial [Verrucomicrobiae bacterium]|nr:hypothetical protein [Verrucomicrobiae bacterium]
PEIRPPSIRGQLHWWFRALGGTARDEDAIFGSVHSQPVLASKIVVRVSGANDGNGSSPQKAEINTLPHKRGGEASPKWAFKPGTTFDLHLLERLGGLTDDQRQTCRRTLEAWLLAGTLGLRATRAGGSFIWHSLADDGIPMPGDVPAYSDRLTAVFNGAPLRVMLLKKSFSNAEAARHCVSDTLGGRDYPQDTNHLARLRDPLGRVFGGRKTSPLRFRIVKLGSGFHIVATWDDRSAVTGNQPGDLKGIIDLLANREKPVGDALRDICV